MKGKNFAPAFFLVGGVIAVAMLAPKPKRRNGGNRVYEITITNDMIIAACDALGVDNDAQAVAAHILQVNYPDVPPQSAMEEVLQEIREVRRIANDRGMTLCDLAVYDQSARDE